MPTSTALLASAFVSMLGLNTHVDYTVGPYSNTPVVESSIRYLGVKNLRDCALSSRALTIWPEVVAATGARFDGYMPRSSPDDMQKTLNFTPQLAAAGVLNFLEGANEPDTAPALAAGNSLSYSAWFQQKVYATGKTYGLKVINLSVGAGWTSADGWQGNYDSIGDLSAYADYANAHTYPVINTGFPNKAITRLNALALLGAPGRPVITSELGWNTATIDPNVVAANMLNGIMDAAYLGDAKTYIFALFDDGSGKWGIMNGDGTPRPAGKALHNLIAMLADSSSSFTPGSLTYDITGLKGTERTLTLAKSDGSTWLAVWDETSAPHGLTVTLPSVASQMQVFAPKASASAIQTASNVQSVSISLGDSPVFVRIVPSTSTTTTTTTTTTTISSRVNNTTITADATTSSMLIYGTGNTVNAGPATTLIQAYAGGNIINASSSAATISIGNFGTRINVGSGATRINDSGANNVIAFSTIGGGLTDIYGYIFDHGTKLNLATVLANTQWDGASATIGNFLRVSISGTTATVSVTPSGVAGGVSYNIVALHDQASLTLTKVLNNAILF